MTINDEILLNQYGQNLVDVNSFEMKFNYFNLDEKRNYLTYLLFLIGQSKPLESDIPIAILNSKLRPAFTPCVLLQKGVKYHNLMNIVELPENELNKALTLLLNLFSVAYQRRYETEKAEGNKWWYSDLSDNENVRVNYKPTFLRLPLINLIGIHFNKNEQQYGKGPKAGTTV